MFEKYKDTPAAICLGIYLLGAIFYVFQLLFMTEQWLANELIGPEAIGVARVLGFAYLGYVAGLLMTYKKGPDGHGVFFVSLLVAQIGTFLNLWHSPQSIALPFSQTRSLGLLRIQNHSRCPMSLDSPLFPICYIIIFASMTDSSTYVSILGQWRRCLPLR